MPINDMMGPMDARNRRELGKITGNLPKHLADPANITREEVDVTQENIIIDYLKHGNPDARSRKMLEQCLRDGKFRTSETVENEKTIREIDRYYDWAIKKAQRKGLLSDPTKDKSLQRRLIDMRKHGVRI